jgi:hypothetical protein
LKLLKVLMLFTKESIARHPATGRTQNFQIGIRISTVPTGSPLAARTVRHFPSLSGALEALLRATRKTNFWSYIGEKWKPQTK